MFEAWDVGAYGYNLKCKDTIYIGSIQLCPNIYLHPKHKTKHWACPIIPEASKHETAHSIMPEAWNIRYWVHLVTHEVGKHKTRHCGHLTRHKDEEHEKIWASIYHLTRKHEILEASNYTRIIGENQMYWSNQIMPEVWKQEILGHSIMPEDKEDMLFGASDKSFKGKKREN